MSQYLQALRRLPKSLTLFDKMVLVSLLVVIVATSGLWWRNVTRWWAITPIKGGTYIEGIVNTDPYDLDLTISKLTKMGLTYTDHHNHIKGALANRWEISQDGKNYTFHLRPGLNAKHVAQSYSALPEWQSISINASDNQTIEMSLKQPFAPLLSFTSDPVVDGEGPYSKEKQTDNEISFVANKDFILGEPNIQHLILMLYPDDKALKAALQRQEVMGADLMIQGVPNTDSKKLGLTKQTILIFNVEKPLFADKKIRQQIRDNQKLDKSISATLVTSQDPTLLELANQFSKRAAKLGLTISVKSLNPIVLERDILSTDNYDLLLTDLNYGYDEDPYPYWHSSQIITPGKNYAGYNNKEADKLIEDARQTLDDVERQKKYSQFQQLLDQDIPAIFYPKQIFSYTVSTRIKGITEGTGVVPADRYTEVWLWFIKAKRQHN